MEVIKINSIADIPLLDCHLTASIGEFDGIHLAHQYLIKRVLKTSINTNTKSAIITFDPHPDQLIKKDVVKTIFSLNEKIKSFAKYGIDYLFIINFDEKLLKMPHQEFTKNYLKPLKIVNLVVGFDFRYGYLGLGNKDTILKEGIKNIEVIDKMYDEEQIISSTYIKELLVNGKVEIANKLLDKNFTLIGEVIHGRNVGEKINVPTANLLLSHNYPDLKEGVYAVKCKINDQKYMGIANIGHNPSFNYYQNLSYEIHIIEEGFDKDLYNQTIEVEFIKYLRCEKVFESIEAFKEQINQDKKEAVLILNNAL